MKRFVFFFLIIIVGSFGWRILRPQPVTQAPPQTRIIETWETPTPVVSSDIHKDLTDLTNSYRTQPLVEDTKLDASAQAKCEYMQEKKYWAHDEPSGRTWASFIPQPYFRAGENLARNFRTNQQMFVGWMNSPTHRANIVEPQFDHVGFGICDGPEGHLVVQYFTDTDLK
jgi:uncharacterized protein YkwD